MPRFLTTRECMRPVKKRQVDPKTAESLRAGGSMAGDKDQSRLEKEYQALKERNALVEAQLEAMK